VFAPAVRAVFDIVFTVMFVMFPFPFIITFPCPTSLAQQLAGWPAKRKIVDKIRPVVEYNITEERYLKRTHQIVVLNPFRLLRRMQVCRIVYGLVYQARALALPVIARSFLDVS
jgi:hypothetical protein